MLEDALVFTDDVGETGGCCKRYGFCSALLVEVMVGAANVV